MIDLRSDTVTRPTEAMVDRLAEDYRTAKRFAEGLNRIDTSLCDSRDVETNLVRVDVTKSGLACWRNSRRSGRSPPCG